MILVIIKNKNLFILPDQKLVMKDYCHERVFLQYRHFVELGNRYHRPQQVMLDLRDLAMGLLT